MNQEITANPAVAGRFRAFFVKVAEPNEMLCRECGEPMFIVVEGTSHHVRLASPRVPCAPCVLPTLGAERPDAGDGMDGIDHDRDRDHTATADGEG